MTADLMTYARSTATAEECARNGLAWLKEYGPQFGLDWKRINAKTLDIASVIDCALAQSKKNGRRRDTYSDLLYEIGEELGIEYKDLVNWSGQHGFNTRYASGTALNIAWTRLLRKERSWSVQLAWFFRPWIGR